MLSFCHSVGLYSDKPSACAQTSQLILGQPGACHSVIPLACTQTSQLILGQPGASVCTQTSQFNYFRSSGEGVPSPCSVSATGPVSRDAQKFGLQILRFRGARAYNLWGSANRARAGSGATREAKKACE